MLGETVPETGEKNEYFKKFISIIDFCSNKTSIEEKRVLCEKLIKREKIKVPENHQEVSSFPEI